MLRNIEDAAMVGLHRSWHGWQTARIAVLVRAAAMSRPAS